MPEPTLMPELTSILDIFAMIKGERVYQDIVWGDLNKNPHELLAWAKIVELRWDYVKKALNEEDYAEAKNQMLKVATIIVATLEQHGIKEIIQ